MNARGVGTADTVHSLCHDCVALITLIWEVFNMGGLNTLFHLFTCYPWRAKTSRTFNIFHNDGAVFMFN